MFKGRRWIPDKVALENIFYTQDTIRDSFQDGSPLEKLIERFGGVEDPDEILQTNRISVAPYPEVNGRLYSLDNRRLFCLKRVYPADKQIWVYRYASISDYDTEWDNKFTTVTEGESIVVRPSVKKTNSRGSESRFISIPTGMEVDADNIKRSYALLTGAIVHPPRPADPNRGASLEVRGRRRRDVDVAAAQIYNIWTRPAQQPEARGGTSSPNAAEATATSGCTTPVSEMSVTAQRPSPPRRKSLRPRWPAGKLDSNMRYLPEFSNGGNRVFEACGDKYRIVKRKFCYRRSLVQDDKDEASVLNEGDVVSGVAVRAGDVTWVKVKLETARAEPHVAASRPPTTPMAKRESALGEERSRSATPVRRAQPARQRGMEGATPGTPSAGTPIAHFINDVVVKYPYLTEELRASTEAFLKNGVPVLEVLFTFEVSHWKRLPLLTGVLSVFQQEVEQRRELKQAQLCNMEPLGRSRSRSRRRRRSRGRSRNPVRCELRSEPCGDLAPLRDSSQAQSRGRSETRPRCQSPAPARSRGRSPPRPCGSSPAGNTPRGSPSNSPSVALPPSLT